MKQLIDYQVKNNKELMDVIIIEIDYQRVITRLTPLFYAMTIAQRGLEICCNNMDISLSGKTKRMGAK
jgi:hypothetical protein